ncbi:hypothetical protein DPMN_140983 [Dreissena polymorpha]|uniref:Uncharacterized protein n=1 Tax=Dreissena polymorpha TaxID=45954 RepID=A0A9D4GBX4_DREPO|nr:hypothetical protein DPMN_140983 [Dreissena polymorpha]
MLSLDITHMTIVVENGSDGLFKILQDTNIAILELRTANCASMASVIMYTLKKLTKLRLRGTYSGRCTLQLPATLQCISLQEVDVQLCGCVAC